MAELGGVIFRPIAALLVAASATFLLAFSATAGARVRIVSPSEAPASKPVRFVAVPGAHTEAVSFYVDGQRRWVDRHPSWKFGRTGRVALSPGHHVLAVRARQPGGTVTTSKQIEIVPAEQDEATASETGSETAAGIPEAGASTETGQAAEEAVQAGSVLEAGFEDGLSNWNIAGVGEAVPSIESGDVREGSDAARVLLTGSQERSELSLGGDGTREDDGMFHFHDGDEYWYGFSFDIQQMVWGHPGAHNVIMQFKSEGTGSPEFALQLWNYAGDDGHSGGKGLWSHSNPDAKAPGGDRFLAPVGENEWHDVAIHFKASDDHQGFYEIFLDGQLVEARSAQTMIVPGKEFAYIKDGLYRNGQTIPGTSELLLDSARLGTTQAAVSPRQS